MNYPRLKKQNDDRQNIKSRQSVLSLRILASVILLVNATPSSNTAFAQLPVPFLLPGKIEASRPDAEAPPKLGSSLTDNQMVSLAKLALDGVHREFPNKPSNVMTTEADVLSPRQMHPAFYGCFDWHSSVHGHWMLVRLLRLNPEHPSAQASREKLGVSLTKDNLQKEADYFNAKENRSFERMYGWAWLLQLTAELHEFDDPQAKEWRENLRPLENKIVELTMGYLPRLSYPIRTGVHPDTAFALGLTLDYARVVKNAALEQQIVQRAKDFYLSDHSYNSDFEPSGEDFFSASLNEADLMSRVLAPNEYREWIQKFLPGLLRSKPEPFKLLTPVSVSDVTDGKLVHLAGLNLSRSWCLQRLATKLESLSDSDQTATQGLRQSANVHAQAGFDYVFSGHYEGEHWLGTFAVYALTLESKMP